MRKIIVLEDKRPVQNLLGTCAALRSFRKKDVLYSVTKSLKEFKALTDKLKQNAFFILDVNLPDGLSKDVLREVVEKCDDFAIFTALPPEDFTLFKKELESHDLFKGRIYSKLSVEDVVALMKKIDPKVDMDARVFLIDPGLVFPSCVSLNLLPTSMNIFLKMVSQNNVDVINVVGDEITVIKPIKEAILRYLKDYKIYNINVVVNEIVKPNQINLLGFLKRVCETTLSRALKNVVKEQKHDVGHENLKISKIIKEYINAP
jgi:hypothetical protein